MYYGIYSRKVLLCTAVQRGISEGVGCCCRETYNDWTQVVFLLSSYVIDCQLKSLFISEERGESSGHFTASERQCHFLPNFASVPHTSHQDCRQPLWCWWQERSTALFLRYIVPSKHMRSLLKLYPLFQTVIKWYKIQEWIFGSLSR